MKGGGRTVAERAPEPQALLKARLDDYLLGCFLSLGLALLSGVPLLFSWGEYIAIACVLIGIWLASSTGLKAMAVQRDLREGVVIERCRIITAVTVRREVLSVRTSRGTLMLANHTGRRGVELTRRWVVLTYAPHAALALRAEDE